MWRRRRPSSRARRRPRWRATAWPPDGRRDVAWATGSGRCRTCRRGPMDEKTAPPMTQQAPATQRRWGPWKWLAVSLLLLIGAYLVTVYLVIPALWKRHFERHPSLDDVPGLTHTADGHPGDPINVALIGTKAQLV